MALLAVSFSAGQPADSQPPDQPTITPAASSTNSAARLPAEITRSFIIPIRGEINADLADAIQNEVNIAKAAKAQMVIFDLDTPGGYISSAADISKLIKNELRDIYTVAFVDSDAISAGAWLALSCDQIVMTPRGKIGDSASISLQGTIEGVEREKLETYLRKEFRDLAISAGYSPALSESMVSASVEVWEIRSVDSGQTQFVNREDWKGRLRLPTTVWRTRGGEDIASNSDADWEFVRVVVPEGRLLTMTAPEAKELGFATVVLDSIDELCRHFNIAVNPANLGATADQVSTGVLTRPGPAPTTEPTTQPMAGWFANPERTVAPPPLPDEITRAFIIPIHGGIGPSMAKAIERKVITVKAKKAQMVIFDFNTPGGRVDSTMDISGLIKNELRGIYTVAFVDPEAISAGALLSLACDQIVMVQRGKIGDCAPISMQGTIEGVEREKIETYVRAEFRDSALAAGYWPAVAEAMVSASIEVWEIRNVQTGELQFVNRENWIGRVRLPSPVWKTRGGEEIASNPEAEWEFVRVVVAEDRILTLTTSEARALGFTSVVVDELDGLRKHFNITVEPEYLGDTWSEDLVAILTSMWLTALLVLLGSVFIYMEIHTPGFGVFGALAIMCFALLFGSRFLTGLAQWWEIGLFVLGLVLLALEIFVTPGFGVLGISGMLMCLVGLLSILVANPPDMPPLPEPGLVMDTFLDGLFAMGAGFIGAIILAIVLARFLPHIPVASRLVLGAAPSASEYAPSDESDPIRHIAAGDRGTVEALCRPAGKARFGDNLIDVMAEGDFIGPGTPVVVLRNEGNRLVVRRAENDKT